MSSALSSQTKAHSLQESITNYNEFLTSNESLIFCNSYGTVLMAIVNCRQFFATQMSHWLESGILQLEAGNTCCGDLLKPGRLTFKTIQLDSSGLPSGLEKAWRLVQQSNPELGSPYFSPEFTIAAAAARDDTEVAVAFDGDTPVAFLPFHRVGRQSAIPVGGAINDYHGVVAPPGLTGTLERLISGAGLKRFEFHSLWHPVAEVEPWAVDSRIVETSAAISGGETDYLDELPKHSRTIWKQGQKTRRMIRELGPLRFEWHDPDPARLQWLIDLKRNKYRRTGCTDFFAPAWSRNLLAEIHQTQTPEFRGVLGVLYAGEQAVAAHFGMATPTVLHYWYPVYDPRFGIYSPGSAFYLQLVSQAISTGIRRIDFGYGQETFKMKLANRQGRLACGCTGAGQLELLTRKFCYRTHQRIKQSRFRSLIRNSVRFFWPSAGKPVVR